MKNKMILCFMLCGLLFLFACQSTSNQSASAPAESTEPSQNLDNGTPTSEQDSRMAHSTAGSSAPLHARPLKKGTSRVKSDKAALSNKSHSETLSDSSTLEEAHPIASAPRKYTVPEGTEISVRLIDAISTETNEAGDTFMASLSEPLKTDGVTLFPQDTFVKGKVVSVEEPGRVHGVASISLELTELQAGKGKSVPIKTETFAEQAKAEKKKDAAIIGGGAGIGTAIGAIAGGKKGAVIGAAIGGAGSTGYVLSTKGKQIKYPSETLMTFKLAERLTVSQ
jgi:hypothetical protein